MGNLFYNISQVLGITILHSLWQGLIVYMLLRLVLQLAPQLSANAKYKAAFGALAVLLLWFMYTLFTEVNNYTWLTTANVNRALPANILLPALVNNWAAPIGRYYFIIAGYLPYITIIYLAGLVFNALKMTMALNNVYRMRQHITEAGFREQVTRLSQKISIRKQVQVAYSQYIDVPCITGFLKPIILLPLSISSYLTAEEITAILLHELAHIRRNDYLLNLVQQVIGVLLFFNPFSALISRIINREREHCCDDVVVQTTGTPLIYAQALLKLEENNQQQFNLALAATGNKYYLLNRIERIMKTKTSAINVRPALIALVLLLCSLSSIAWFNPKLEHGKISIKKVSPVVTAPSVAVKPAGISSPAINQPQAKMATYKVVNDTLTQADTLKNKKKIKIVVEDENGNKKEYNSIKEMPDEVKNDFYKQTAGVDMKMSDSLKKVFSSPQWQKQMAEMQANAMNMSKKMNSQEYKMELEKVLKQSAEIAKLYNTPQWQKQMAEMQKSAIDMAGKMNTPEFKKQMEEITTMGEKMGMEMEKYYETPEGKKKLEEMQKSAMDMAKQFDTPEWRKQMEELGKINMDKNNMDDYTNDKVKKATKKEIEKAMLKVQAELKKLTEQYKKAEKEKPEKKEKPEQPEKKEKPEQPEKTEQ